VKYLGDKKWLEEDLTVADFRLYDLENLIALLDAKFFEKYPTLKAHNERFTSIPEIKKYLESENFKKTPIVPDSSLIELLKA